MKLVHNYNRREAYGKDIIVTKKTIILTELFNNNIIYVNTPTNSPYWIGSLSNKKRNHEPKSSKRIQICNRKIRENRASMSSNRKRKKTIIQVYSNQNQS